MIAYSAWSYEEYFVYVKLNMFALRKYWLQRKYPNCGIYDEKRGKDFQFFSEMILISTTMLRYFSLRYD